jgi:hypothetical protein
MIKEQFPVKLTAVICPRHKLKRMVWYGMVCVAVQFVRSLAMPWRNILASSSGSKSKMKAVHSSKTSETSTRVHITSKKIVLFIVAIMGTSDLTRTKFESVYVTCQKYWSHLFTLVL